MAPRRPAWRTGDVDGQTVKGGGGSLAGSQTTTRLPRTSMQSAMEVLWLGYDGLSVRYADVAAVLFYRPSLDARVIETYGRIPANIQSIVVTGDGAFFPSSWSAADLRQRLARWRDEHV